MTVAAAVKTRLLDLAPLTALVATRVYVQRLPQSPVLPAVRVEAIDAVEPFQNRGPDGTIRARVQVDSVAVTLAEAEAVSAAVHGDGAGADATGLSGWTGDLGSPPFHIALARPIDVRVLNEPAEHQPARPYRVIREYMVTYRST